MGAAATSQCRLWSLLAVWTAAMLSQAAQADFGLQAAVRLAETATSCYLVIDDKIEERR